MRKLLPVVILVVLFLTVVDIGAKSFAQSQLASAAKSRSVNVRRVTVHYDGLPDELRGFPFMLDVLADGKVSKATVELHDVTVSPLPMHLVRARIDGLQVGRSAMFGTGRSASASGNVRVTVSLTPKNLSDLLNTPVELRRGYVHALIDGTVIDGKVSVSGRSIVITDENHPPVKLDMPGKDYLPCTPTGVSVSRGGMTLSCNSRGLPASIEKVLD